MAAHLAEPGHQELTLQMLVDVKTKVATTVLPGSEALWVIPNVAARIAAQVQLTSGRYALGPFGYQFQLQAHFHSGGFQLSCGTQPGPYDSVLEWPLSRSFTLSLLGNGGGGLDKAVQADMPANASDRCFNKGKTGFRGPVLASLGELQTGGYIQDDALVVKVAFETPLDVIVLPGSEALWVVRNVAAHLAAKTKMDSGRYALGPFGHQFQLMADFGDDDLIGLYCGTAPGPYDDALAWPFSRSFTLTLLGRGGSASGMDRSQRILFPANANERSFSKGTKTKVGRSVCTLAELEAGGYIQNDSLLVKVVFDADSNADPNDEPTAVFAGKGKGIRRQRQTARKAIGGPIGGLSPHLWPG
jgi:hypothetical protein